VQESTSYYSLDKAARRASKGKCPAAGGKLDLWDVMVNIYCTIIDSGSVLKELG
jgi:hypothetical protein